MPAVLPNRRKDPSESKLPDVAVITMARDEGRMLSRWVDFYGSAFGTDNLLVFDDNSVDGSTDNLGCSVFHLPQLPGIGRYERTRNLLMSGIAEGLLQVYDFVIFVDVDEFLMADPAKHASLREFLAARRDRDVIAPMTLNVMHHVGAEPPLDPDRPILDQRSFAKFLPVMCKPSIKQIPAPWNPTSHAISAPFEVDPELFMLHLKFYDAGELRATAALRNAMVKADGRATKSSWSRTGDQLVAQITEASARVDPDSVKEFDPQLAELDGIVQQQREGIWQPSGMGQVPAMSARPLVRIPERLRGLL
ncbi:MAG TPA: glycosyltransferase family 2 protein [Jatrophihabitans sp.]|nr:glycosyltransferase family 2 protein [Jatrophihabitans sp.]